MGIVSKWHCMDCMEEVEQCGDVAPKIHNELDYRNTDTCHGPLISTEAWLKWGGLRIVVEDIQEVFEDIIERTKIYAGGDSRFCVCGEDRTLNWIHDRADSGLRLVNMYHSKRKEDGTAEQD